MAAADRKTDYLAQVKLFASLNKKELRMISRVSDELKAPAGQELVTEGARGHEFYLVLSGEAVVIRGGREVARLGPGTYFGEMALLDRGPRTATIVADTDMELIVLGQREFFGLLDEVPSVANKMLVAMAGRLRDADTRAYSH